MSDGPDALLIRKGRVLTPGSRTRYRWTRLRSGRTLLLDDPEGLVGIVALSLRCLTLPILAAVDLFLWPLARLTLARGPWYVVALTFDGPDPRFARVAEAGTRQGALRRRRDVHKVRGL